MTFKISDIEDMLQSHMNDQPYRIECANCNANLDASSTVDCDGDLFLSVEPCNCIKDD